VLTLTIPAGQTLLPSTHLFLAHDLATLHRARIIDGQWLSPAFGLMLWMADAVVRAVHG